MESGKLAAVAGVLTLLAATLWWLRRRGIAAVLPAGVLSRGLRSRRRAAARRLECLERLPLGPQHMLHLVRLGETAMLVASSPGGCSLVRSFPASEVDGRREALR
jgi:flagellar biogenesis protein FliO